MFFTYKPGEKDGSFTAIKMQKRFKLSMSYKRKDTLPNDIKMSFLSYTLKERPLKIHRLESF